MSKYIKKSVEKLRQDALSKIFYDILKWLILIIIGFTLTKYLPTDFSLSIFLLSEVKSSVYVLGFIALIVILGTTLLVRWIFLKRYLVLLKDNFTDELTGLKNHKALESYLDDRIPTAQKMYEKISVILIDIDDFKEFNTTIGYKAADKVLAKVGQLLDNDKRATDEIFRQFLRGDEFLIVANDTSASEAFLAAERKRKLIDATTFVVDGKDYRLKVSCGVTELQGRQDSVEGLRERVNSALLDAKSQKSKNCTKSRS